MVSIYRNDDREDDYRRVYLTSYPRSGNQLMRRYLEEATGILTSSVYPDPDTSHSSTLYPWKGYIREGGYEGNRRHPRKKEIIVLKTHYPAIVTGDIEHEPPPSKAIRIVRHPIDSIYSLYLFAYGRADSPIPQLFLESEIKTWRVYQEFWNRQERVVTYRFEDIMTRPFWHLKKIINHIGYDATNTDIQRAIDRYPPNSPTLKHAQHFTDEQIALIDTELRPLLEQFGYTLPATNL